jgi:hypothetical protein
MSARVPVNLAFSAQIIAGSPKTVAREIGCDFLFFARGAFY